MGFVVFQVVILGWLGIKELNALEQRLAFKTSDFFELQGAGNSKFLSRRRWLGCVRSCVLEGRSFLKELDRKLKIMVHRAETVATWNMEMSLYIED